MGWCYSKGVKRWSSLALLPPANAPSNSQESKDMQLTQPTPGWHLLPIHPITHSQAPLALHNEHYLEHLHPAAERQALEMRFEGFQACTKFFRVALPHRYLAYWFFNPKNYQEYFQKVLMILKMARFTESQVDEAPECGRSKSNAHPRG
jgi:hypothetical protein